MLERVTALAAAIILAPALALACEDVAHDNGTEHAENCDAEIVGDAARGEDAYAAACVECHAVPARIMRGVRGADDAEKAAWLDEFLVDHFAPDDQARADIIEYMLGL